MSDLHAQGGYVAVLDMNAENGEAFIKELGDTTRARFFEVDVSDTDDVEKCVGAVVAWSKETGKQIGGVVAAAGVGNPGKVSRNGAWVTRLEAVELMITRGGDWFGRSHVLICVLQIIDRDGEPLSLEGFDFVISINLRGVIDLCRQLLSTIVKNDPSEDAERGVLILVSSVAAYDGIRLLAPYSYDMDTNIVVRPTRSAFLQRLERCNSLTHIAHGTRSRTSRRTSRHDSAWCIRVRHDEDDVEQSAKELRRRNGVPQANGHSGRVRDTRYRGHQEPYAECDGHTA